MTHDSSPPTSDFDTLMRIFSTPRPNGSPACERTWQALEGWLADRGVTAERHSFRLYPFRMEMIGLWLIVSRALLAAGILLRWGWPAFWIALLGLPGGLLDYALHLPLVSWPGARPAHNILVHFDPAGEARQELILSAHYDSKTELLDHRQRMFFLRSVPVGILLSLLLAALGPLDRLLLDQGSRLAGWTYLVGCIFSLALLALALGLGMNLSTGRLLPPSPGAVDNGAACAILAALAEDLAKGEAPLHQTRLSLAWFAGEEVNMQGSRAYAQSRTYPLSTAAINLEVLGQDGDYVLWERDGSIFKLLPCSADLNRLAGQAVQKVTGTPPRLAGPITSDGGSFLLGTGIPATTLGTYHTRWVDRGFHHPSDNLARVQMARLPEALEILHTLIQNFDEAGL